ncbi:unnamed protein product [Allacma fusca]|uniref:RRM domain-containing protein n=1 Tax=Allacma fusca TaxID=39272 RepID=A0A8J2PBP5_9HEXA|nr:unnamed protein product [Allacma fusca]
MRLLNELTSDSVYGSSQTWLQKHPRFIPHIVQSKVMEMDGTNLDVEIRELLAEWDVQSVTIQSGSARVALCSPEVLEEWDRNAAFTLRGQRVTIVPSPTEMLLCVGRLPLSYTEQQFTALVSAYGDVKRSFLMISERIGESKGYGFVEYVTKEAALQAKNALDGRQILDFTAVCDWLDSSHVTVRSLHSKCLYVDRLPPNYRDMGEFRRIFSTVVNPPYCQIALKNGCPLDWGLVEFTGEDDAERTQQNLDGFVLHGHSIRVAYYIPGVRAINLYLKLLNDGGSSKGKSALLPDPPAPAVFQQLQSLAKQNPVFAQNLQSIILQQIQDVQKGKGQTTNDPHQGKRSPFQKTSPFSPPVSSPNNGLNIKNAQQTALTLLLASQLQNGGNGGNVQAGSGGGSGSLSPNSAQQNQQLLSALQAMSKGGDHFLNGIPVNNGPNLSSLLGLASPNMPPMSQADNTNIPHGFFPSPVMLSGVNNGAKEDQWSSYNKSSRNNSFASNGMHKNPLLPSPSGVSSPGLDVPMDTGMNAPKSPPGDPLQAVWYSLFGHSSPPETVPNTPGNTSPLFMKSPMSSSNGSPIGRGDNMFGMSHGHNSHKNSPPGFVTPNGHHQGRVGTGDLQDAINSLLSNPQNLSHLFGNNTNGGNISPPPQFANHGHHGHSLQNSHQHRLNQMGGSMDNNGVSNAILDLLMQSMKGDHQQHPHHMPPSNDGFHNPSMKHNSWSTGISSPPSPIGNNRPFMTNGHGQPIPQRSGSNGSSEMSSSSPRSPSYSPFSRNCSKGLMESGNGNVSPTPTPWSNSVLGSPPHPGFGTSSFQNRIWAPSVSPGGSNNLINSMGQKRKVNHESMSETEFIGHQPPGLTSHYADSYFKKKKKN